MAVTRLLRFSLTTANLDRLGAFYRDAFGCVTLHRRDVSGAAFESLMGVSGGAHSLMLGLGAQRIELLQFEQPGAPYPSDAAASDLFFQHFALVVADMAQAFGRLTQVAGWSAISQPGPQHLPAQSGGVSAFKFRDPDGHPLELLAFAPQQVPPAWQSMPHGPLFQGIDHSAISVADNERSIAFYEALGLSVAARSLNCGPEQARLDGLVAPEVDVTALALTQGVPHLELLCYRGINRGAAIALRNNDIAATRVIFEGEHERGLIDPDGHHLLMCRESKETLQLFAAPQGVSEGS
jgi:catechol 2,3-dioxygenase-like lactoylglutathione lyase family enzyme